MRAPHPISKKKKKTRKGKTKWTLTNIQVLFIFYFPLGNRIQGFGMLGKHFTFTEYTSVLMYFRNFWDYNLINPPVYPSLLSFKFMASFLINCYCQYSFWNNRNHINSFGFPIKNGFMASLMFYWKTEWPRLSSSVGHSSWALALVPVLPCVKASCFSVVSVAPISWLAIGGFLQPCLHLGGRMWLRQALCMAVTSPLLAQVITVRFLRRLFADLFPVLGIELRTPWMSGKHSTTELPQESLRPPQPAEWHLREARRQFVSWWPVLVQTPGVSPRVAYF